MLKTFYPDEYVESTFDIAFEALYEEGYRGIIFDIDNTLVPHGAPADERSITLFKRLKDIGFACCFLSNNDEPRVKMFNEEIQVHYIYKAKKPLPKNYEKAMDLMGTNRENTLSIGDQIFTDVWGAKKAGIRNIMVKWMDPNEKFTIRLKRFLERIVLYFYKKSLKKK